MSEAPVVFTTTLPLPPTVNHALVPVRGRLIKSSAARNWLNVAKILLKAKYRFAPMAGPLEVDAQVFVNTISSDGPNRDKPLHDALTGIVWHDDCQVVRWSGSKHLTDVAPYVHVTVRATTADSDLTARLAKSKKAGGE